MNTTDSKLALLAARLLETVMAAGLAGSDAEAVREAVAQHDARALYPKLVVSAPHGGGEIFIDLCLCNPETGEPEVQIFAAEAIAEDASWAH